MDILQPDINWCGGVSTCQKVAAASAPGQRVILHAGGTTAFGQHFSYASPVVPWCECFVGTAPGLPPGGQVGQGYWPGQALPKGGRLLPSDAPGFGLDIPEARLTPYF